MGASTEEVAKVLQDANERGFRAGRRTVLDLIGDQVEYHHVPAHAHDGAMTKAQFAFREADQETAFREAMPDFAQEDVLVRVEGNRIILSRTLHGTLSDGRVFRAPFVNTYIVTDGVITHIEPHFSPEDSSVLQEILRQANDYGPTPSGPQISK
jgi:hypothetical protein